MKYLLDYKPLAAYIAFAIGVASAFLFPDGISKMYIRTSDTLVNTSFTMLGFLLAAVTLLLTIQDRPFVMELKKLRPQLWNEVVSEFFTTTYLFGIVGLLILFIGDQRSYLDSNTYKLVFIGCLVFLVSLSIIQVGKIIYLLRVLSKS